VTARSRWDTLGRIDWRTRAMRFGNTIRNFGLETARNRDVDRDRRPLCRLDKLETFVPPFCRMSGREMRLCGWEESGPVATATAREAFQSGTVPADPRLVEGPQPDGQSVFVAKRRQITRTKDRRRLRRPMTKGRDRNQPCSCGSGKKYKKCCGATSSLAANQIALPGGHTMTVNQVNAWLDVRSPLRVPEMLLQLAQWATGQAARPKAPQSATMMVIIMVATTGEAIVNALLEPLVPEEEWEGRAKNKGLERQSPAVKWARLSTELGLSPTLDRTISPLKEFLEIVNIRHELIHFKHGKNVRRGAIPLPTAQEGLRATISAPAPWQEPNVYRDTRLLEKLGPENAAGYYAALENLVRPLLDHVKGDPYDTASNLRDMFDRPVAIEAGKNGNPV
jgi:hypothetical protein